VVEYGEKAIMAKPKNPLFGFNARGTLAKTLTFRRRGQETIAEAIPTHPDAHSPDQLSWRTMYEACAALWHSLSDTEKQAWHSLAVKKHMTGFALWQSQCLRPNPGIYLPLAGGTMQGDIDMATKKVLNLPAPTADEEPSRKTDLEAHTGATANVHGVDIFTRDLRKIWRTGTYMPSLLYTNDYLSSANPLVANQLEAIGYPIPRAMTFDRIGLYISTGGAAGTHVRIGIYNDDGNCYPGTLVLDAGLVAADGSAGIREIVINQQLTKGLYWLAMISDGTPSAWGQNDYYLGLFGNTSALHLFYSAWYKASAYGALPATFPSGATPQIRLFNIAMRVLTLP
jgi:hypothetical protein